MRIARTLEDQLVVSRTAAGRGAWLCTGQVSCFDMAARRKAFDRAYRQPVPATALAVLRDALFGNVPRNLRD